MKAAVVILLVSGCGSNVPPNPMFNNHGLDGGPAGDAAIDGPNASLSSSAAVLPFGTVLVATRSAGLTTTVSNQGGPSVISSLVVTGTGADAFVIDSDTCLGATVVDTTTCVARLRFAPTTATVADAMLTVNGSAGGTASIVLKGTGAVAGALAFMPSDGAFSNVAVTAVSDLTLQLQNVGTTPSGTITVELSGPDVGLFHVISSNCGGLAPSDGCSLTVEFSPVSPGARNATLSASDALGGTMTAALSGTGI